MKFSIKFLDEFLATWRTYVAEFLATLVFVFFATSVVIVDSLYGGVGKVGQALAISFVYIPLLFATINVSGGYLNPAVTLSLWLGQKMTGTRAICLIVAQILGSFAASGLAVLVLGSWARQFGYGMPILGVGVSAETGIALEAILTAVLVFVVYATMVDSRGPGSFGPLAVGLFLFGMTIVFEPISGGVANVSRVVGPALWANTYNNLPVYVVGGLIGSLFGFVYELAFLKKSKKK